MLQRKDLLELTRRFTIDRCHLDRVAGAYFDRENEIDGTFNVHMQDLSPHEKNVNLSHFKDVLFGPTNETVVEMPCPGSYAETDQEAMEVARLMEGLRSTGLKNDGLLDILYDLVAQAFPKGVPFEIVLGHGLFDVPRKTSDGEEQWESDVMYDYLIGAVCPLLTDYEPDTPVAGFLYPSFYDRMEDEDHMVLMDGKNGYSLGLKEILRIQ